MESIMENQQELYGAMAKIAINLKKDSAERKSSSDYFKRRLETLEAYWSDYKYNHDRLSTEGSRTLPYFTNNEFEKANDVYKATKALINEQYQVFMKRAKVGEPTISGAQKPGGSQQEGTSRSLLSEHADQVSNQEDTPQSGVQQASTGSSSKLDDMLKRQASNFRAFLRTVSGIDLNVISQKWELEDALRTLQSRWSTIDSLHLELDSELEGMDAAYEISFTKHEATYNEMKKAINSKLWSVSHKEKWTPKMEIPNFNGSYNQWTSFKDLFTEAIHSNLMISNAQKMQFLKGKLKGEAERLIQHLQISTENYSVAWEILNNRYNNLRLIFTTHANTLLNLPTTQQASVTHIKKIHDTTRECLNAIKNLGVDTSSWDPLIVHILLQKVDTESHTHYLESLKNPRELPTLEEFLTFLEIRFTTLESARKKQDISKSANNAQNNTQNSKFAKFNNYTKQSLPAHKGGQPTDSNKNSLAKTRICPLCKESHGLYFCNKFLNMSPQEKLKTVKKLHVCENCLFDHKKQQCTSEKCCRECEGKHNTLIHGAYDNLSVNITIADKKSEQEIAELQQGNNSVEILLATALIKVQAGDGSYHKMRALIDQGSQVSLISEKAAQVLALPRNRCKGIISGIGAKESSCKGVATISCQSVYSTFSFKTEVFIMNTLIKNLPSYTFNKPTWSHLDGIQLSDTDFNVSRPVDILLGADVYSHIIMDGISRSEQAVPVAQQTRLGWILCGNVQTFHCNVVLNQVDELQKFWEIEDISESLTLSEEDNQCINYYKSTTTRRDDGSYVVRIPFKENFEEQLGTSKHTAIAQFHQMEKKFQSNKYIEQEYKSFLKEYESLGHMKPSMGNLKPDCFLPHHCVLRDESSTTALRVVFNASRKTTSGKSLNDLMLKGPNLQQDLQCLLLKWRQFRYAFTADIEKMFRFIWIEEQDQRFQKIIWRDSTDSLIKNYQLCTITYGTKAAPFLAMMTLKQLAEDERLNYQDSEAIRVLQESFYMDDVLHGAQTLESAIQLKQDLIRLLKAGGFNLRKWKSNSLHLLQTTMDDHKQENFQFKQPESTKTLGLRWDPKQDLFTFQSQLGPIGNKLTKRTMLSDISKLYDPLGWLSPVSTKLKLLFQKVWVSKIQWDDKLPDHLIKEWLDIRNDMSNIKEFQLARWLGTKQDDEQIELHGFCDASNKAYACVIYCKLTTNDEVSVSLVAGKSRLVPTGKTVTLPRLELSGALLLVKLMEKVKKCLNLYKIKIHGWVDSMVVLAWIQGDPGKWKPFVANRVRQITEIISPEQWRYVKSAENPADCASRGISVTQLKEHSLWWKGPSWLPKHSSQRNQGESFTTNEEVKSSPIPKQVNHINKGQPNIVGELLTRFSSLQKLTRVLAWILRFINCVKQKQTSHQNYLTLQEINSAKHKLIKYVQQTEFTEEINNILQNKPLKGKLLNLNPILGEDGLLRVGGRLNKANLTPDMRHPIILPHSGILTNLVIDHAHKLTLHGGARVTLATIRQKYWIIGGNRAVKKRLHTCISCRKHNPKKMTQLMGDLPSERCNVAKAFHHTGIDYTGHVFIKANKGRGIKTTKGYIAVFICMVTKLVHLELVSDLTSSAFLAALRRMAARKGSPRHIYCDNGTNFVGASNVLAQEYQQITQTFDQDFIVEITEMGMEWHFNAPSWPTAAGLWEAAVKSVKYHLRRVIGEQRLTFEEYSTILAQTEAILNSRPLCPLTEDPDDLEFLTPSSFININQDMTIMETETDMRTRWFVTQKIIQDIWKRWRTEYLSQLTTRSKWRSQQPNVQINDVVTINDVNLPPGKWALGRVIELHPGTDGHVRVVTLKTKSGIIKRPIVKLSVLPVNKRRIEQEANSTNSVSFDKIPTKKQEKRSRHSFMSLLTLLLFFMGIIGSSSSYNITRLKDKQGLYFDKISDMRLVRDEWKIVSYYDMSPYWQGTVACDKYIKYLNQVCNQLNKTSYCDIITEQLQHEYSELQYYNHLLLSQHSSTRQDKRQRRGLINGVGYVANSLFGVLDERFAEQYQQDILTLQYNENHLASLIKNQTSIIEVEYNVLKRTGDSISKQYKVLNQLSIRLNNLENGLKTEAQRNMMSSDFSMAAIATSNVLRRLQTMQTTLLDTITDIYHGRFNLHLISPEQLKQTLSIISSHLTKDVSLPINDIQTGLKNIYSLLKVKARTTTEYLIFEIRLPLVTRDLFEIMHLLSVPLAVGNASMARIIPTAEYVAINLRKESYLTLSESEIKACLHNEADNFLCYSRSPIYQLKNDVDLCDVEQSTGQCKLTVSTCTNEWVEINKVNKYFYFCCEKCPIRVLCENYAKAEQLEKAGILSIEQGCIIKTENFTIYAHSNDSSNIQTKEQFYVQEIEPINHMINFSITSSLPTNSTPTPVDNQLEDFKRQIDTLKAQENLVQISQHDVHHYTAIYTILAIILVCGVFIIVKRFRKARNKQAGTPSEQATSAAAAVARVEQAILQPAVNIQRRASVGATSTRPTPCVYSVSYSVSERDQNISESRTSVNSEIPLVHKVEKCTTPMPRKANFS